MRAGASIALGMVAAFGMAWPGTGHAANPAASFLACAAETNDAQRLACFDAAVGQAEVAPGTLASAAAAAPLTQEDKFGLRGELKEEKAKKAPELQELDQLQAQVTGVTSKPHGELVVTLENGQAWAEIQTNSGVRVKAGDRVAIKAGALGSYLLVAPNGRSTKVTRVR